MLTVTVPAASYRLTTLAAVKTELGLTAGTDDALLTALIDRASAAVMRYCNRGFALETVTETLRLSGPVRELSLSRWPVVSIASVTENSAALATGDYEINPATGLLIRLDPSDAPRWWPSGKIAVTYQAGYLLPGDSGANLPADIEQATIGLVRLAWFTRDLDPLVKSEEVTGIGTITRWVGGFSDGASLPADIAWLLAPHRQPAIG